MQDSEQLSHSVKVLYGNDCDTGGYLRRFIDLEIPMMDIKIDDYINTFEFDNSESKKIIFNFKYLFNFFSLSLRDINKFIIWFDFYLSCGQFTNLMQLNYIAFIFIYTALVKMKEKEHYNIFANDREFIYNEKKVDFLYMNKIIEIEGYSKNYFELFSDILSMKKKNFLIKYAEEGNWDIFFLKNEYQKILNIPTILNVVNKIKIGIE